MRFSVIPNSSRIPNEGTDVGYLHTDNWNDWFKYQTMYYVTYFDDQGTKHEIGSIKIGQFDMSEDQTRPDLPENFESLDNRFFSLGQDPDYYTSVRELGPETSRAFLEALRDVVLDPEIYSDAIEEDVMGVSLLRYVNPRTISGQFTRILAGGAELTPYRFSYEGPQPAIEEIEPIRLDFEVTPESLPPTNIHVLIGRNGVGKTYLLNAMTRALVSPSTNEANDGFFEAIDDFDDMIADPFSNLVSVTFSAFDDFQIVRQQRNATKGAQYTNVGLRKRVKNKSDEWVTITRNPDDLAKEFSEAAKVCVRGVKADRWRRALTTLEADPLFAEAEVAKLVNVDEQRFGRTSGALYRRLSSGHKIVLLTITKLVEKVEERTLVLMDEPEAHLHPPLLSAFIRAVSDLLINRNGVAIVATHSPVVLQEVPSSCVWNIVRHGHAANATRLEIESFAESVGTLTSEVFGLEVTRSGFHKLLADALIDEEEVNEVVRKFDHEVGAEGRALISSLIAARKADELS